MMEQAKCQQQSLQKRKESLEMIVRDNDLALIDTSAIILGRRSILPYLYKKSNKPIKVSKEFVANAIEYAEFLNELTRTFKVAITHAIKNEIREGIMRLRKWVDDVSKRKYRKAREQFMLIRRLANLDEKFLENAITIYPPKKLKEYVTNVACKIIDTKQEKYGYGYADCELIAATLCAWKYVKFKCIKADVNSNKQEKYKIALISNDKFFQILLKNIYDDKSKNLQSLQDLQNQQGKDQEIIQEIKLYRLHNEGGDCIYKEAYRLSLPFSFDF